MPAQLQQDRDPRQVDYNVALRRVIYVAVFGAVFVVVYGLHFGPGNSKDFFPFVSVGMMAAGAAIVSGGLLGFIFGVPHTRETETASTAGEEQDGDSNQNSSGATAGLSTNYRPNTSLEQISDWLTKMLVGVGLIEIKVIPEKLKGLAAYIARGLGDNDQARAFVLTLLVFFSVCGFVFGFLWARLYLKRWFIEADQVRKLGEKVNQLELRQLADARAFALVTQELNRGQDDPPADPKQVAYVIKAASSPLRAQIFSGAQEASGSDRDAFDYDSKVQAAISIFRGLIESDSRRRYHRNHSELSYALTRQRPPNFEEGLEEISKAIEIRNDLRISGWKYYEFRRARCYIGQDSNFKKGLPSIATAVDQILSDLRVAYSEPDKWEKWIKSEPDVPKWLKLNNIDSVALGSGSPAAPRTI
jgi:hypothetical protein